MMTNGPAATIGEILEIDLPRPRNRLALAEDPKYVHLRSEVLTFLYEKQRKIEVMDTKKKSKPEFMMKAEQTSSSIQESSDSSTTQQQKVG